MFNTGFLDSVPRLRLPLSPLNFLSGDAGNGMSSPLWLPFDRGLIVSRKGLLSAHSFELRALLWAQPVANWPMPVGYQNSVFIGVQQGRILGYDLETGRESCNISVVRDGFLQAVSEIGPVIRCQDGSRSWFEGFDWDGRSLWTHSGFGAVISTPGILLVRENLGESLAALDGVSGNLLWRFSAAKSGDRGPSDISNEITGGLPSVTVVRERVTVIVFDGRVFHLDRRTGEMVAQGRTPVLGSYQVTPESVFFANPFCFSEFDLMQMHEIHRLEYKDEVKPLYGKHVPTLNAFCFSDESIIWTAMHGALMGVSRENSARNRTTWMETRENVLMPLAIPPLIWGGCMYFRQMAASEETPSGLICYGSS